MLCPATAGAQAVARSFDELRPLVKPGETVSVTDREGREVEGQIIELSSSLVLQVPSGRREMTEPDVRSMRLRGNQMTKGLAWGLGVGLASGLTVGLLDTMYCTQQCFDTAVLWTAIGAGAGAGIGAAIGSKSPRYRLIYERPAATAVTMSPLITRRQKGVLVSVRF